MWRLEKTRGRATRLPQRTSDPGPCLASAHDADREIPDAVYTEVRAGAGEQQSLAAARAFEARGLARSVTEGAG